MGKQKRSSNTYQKINTLFIRDRETNNIILDAPFSSPEFELLRNVKWHAEEKVDGTNIRIEVTSHPQSCVESHCCYVTFEVDYKGKTDNAQIPKLLEQTLKEKFPADKVLASLGLRERIDQDEWENHGWSSCDDIPKMYTIYGEGYGVKIQSCGGRYLKETNDFIVFDVKVDGWWLTIDSRNQIAKELGAETCPFIGDFTIDDAIEFVKKGFKSKVSEDKDLDAEGLVLRTVPELRDRKGERLIVKIKTCDFRKLGMS
jgi:hypothetical protein